MLGKKKKKKRYRENPERLCCRIGPSHHLLMPYKTSPATLSQHKMPRSFDLPENMQTFLCFKITLSWDQQCICGASSQSLLLFSIQEMPCQGSFFRELMPIPELHTSLCGSDVGCWEGNNSAKPKHLVPQYRVWCPPWPSDGGSPCQGHFDPLPKPICLPPHTWCFSAVTHMSCKPV